MTIIAASAKAIGAPSTPGRLFSNGEPTGRNPRATRHQQAYRSTLGNSTAHGRVLKAVAAASVTSDRISIASTIDAVIWRGLSDPGVRARYGRRAYSLSKDVDEAVRQVEDLRRVHVRWLRDRRRTASPHQLRILNEARLALRLMRIYCPSQWAGVRAWLSYGIV